MRAFIQPLQSPEGKYYGTKVWTEAGTVEIWLSRPRRPSNRQLQAWYPVAEGELSDLMADGHYETEMSHAVATALVSAVQDIDPPTEE